MLLSTLNISNTNCTENIKAINNTKCIKNNLSNMNNINNNINSIYNILNENKINLNNNNNNSIVFASSTNIHKHFAFDNNVCSGKKFTELKNITLEELKKYKILEIWINNLLE